MNVTKSNKKFHRAIVVLFLFLTATFPFPVHAKGLPTDQKLFWLSSDGQIKIQAINSSGTIVSTVQYGPFTGWAPVTYERNPDGSTLLLWTNNSGQVWAWMLDSSDRLSNDTVYDPSPGWKLMDKRNLQLATTLAGAQGLNSFQMPAGSGTPGIAGSTDSPAAKWPHPSVPLDCSDGQAALGVTDTGDAVGCWQVTPTAIGAQPSSTNLTTFADISPTADVLSLLGSANYDAMKNLMGYYTSGDNASFSSANIGTTAQFTRRFNGDRLVNDGNNIDSGLSIFQGAGTNFVGIYDYLYGESISFRNDQNMRLEFHAWNSATSKWNSLFNFYVGIDSGGYGAMQLRNPSTDANSLFLFMPNNDGVAYIGTEANNTSIDIAPNGTGNIILSNNVNMITGITQYRGTNTVANGVPVLVAKADVVNRQANIGETTLYTVPANGSGMYRASCYVTMTEAATTSSILPNCFIAYTDNDLGQTIYSGLTNTNSSNSVTSSSVTPTGPGIINAQEGTDILYGTGGYASSGATPMGYALHIKLEYLGN